MNWFNRKKNIYNDPNNDYLAPTKTMSRPLMILLIIVMVLVAAAVIVSLFLGGRWLYQNLDGKDTTTTDVVTGSTTDSSPSDQAPVAGTPAAPSLTTTTTTSTPTVIPNTGPQPE